MRESAESACRPSEESAMMDRAVDADTLICAAAAAAAAAVAASFA